MKAKKVCAATYQDFLNIFQNQTMFLTFAKVLSNNDFQEELLLKKSTNPCKFKPSM